MLNFLGNDFPSQGMGKSEFSTPRSVPQVSGLTSGGFSRDQGLTRAAVSSQDVIHL